MNDWMATGAWVLVVFILMSVVVIHGKNPDGGYRTWAKWTLGLLSLGATVNLFYLGILLNELRGG